MPDDPAVVDTNVLVYALYSESEHHAPSRALLDHAQDGHARLCLVPQVLAEFYSVVTSARRVTLPRQPGEVLDLIQKLVTMPGISLLPVPTDTVHRWMTLVRKYAVTGAAAFDVQLVASMLGNGIKRIYTFNRDHFDRFSEVEALTP
jgi:predicted nucleic acid-binding protein